MGKQKNWPKPSRQRVQSEQNGAANKHDRNLERPVKSTADVACHDMIVFHLSKVAEIQAIFTQTDEDGVCHVYSVVEEHSPTIYQNVMKRERMIEKDFPEIRFSFRIRAHQGRKFALAVPLSSQPLFTR